MASSAAALFILFSASAWTWIVAPNLRFLLLIQTRPQLIALIQLEYLTGRMPIVGPEACGIGKRGNELGEFPQAAAHQSGLHDP